MAEKTRSQGKYNSIKSKKQPLCARTVYSCYKLVLFLYALCYMMIGLALLGIGIFVEIERRQYAGLDISLSLPVALLIFVGFFVSINGLCGVIGTLQENVALLRLFLIVSIASFLAQVATAVVIYVYSLDVSSFVSSELAQVLKDYNKNSELRKTMNMVEYKYSCCGISSWHDYVDIVGVCRDGGCIFPESCCSLPQLPSDYNNCTSDSIAEVPPSMTVKLGCFNTFVDWLGGRMDLIGSTTLGFALPQVAGIVWTYLVLRKIREWQCWYTVELATDYENRL